MTLGSKTIVPAQEYELRSICNDHGNSTLRQPATDLSRLLAVLRRKKIIYSHQEGGNARSSQRNDGRQRVTQRG
jgi:hypothetical protein